MSLRKDVRNISDRESAFRFNTRQFSSSIEPPGRWSKGERRRRAFMRRFSRMTPMQRLRILCDINPFRDYKGFIYAFEQRVFDRSGAYIGTRVKYGLTNKMERRRREYGKCGGMRWISYWATDCVKLTGEAYLCSIFIDSHFAFRSYDSTPAFAREEFISRKCTAYVVGRHREFFWKFGIGGDVDIKLEVEQTLIDTAQPD
ncbi:hypothetical protein R3P38DRAFT_2799099 [Favolaschia claudopus]|uniref:Uncharacterized protein n=1 Tax=Favolaschia claudopus TaxID=2862362 RepID=A0AAW0A171_9AGAR